jgi:ATP-dependent Clp protease ATP-binding subunit ClpA
MTSPVPDIPPGLTADELKTRLLDSFEEYHSSIHYQRELVERLVEAVRRERADAAGPTRPRNRGRGR